MTFDQWFKKVAKEHGLVTKDSLKSRSDAYKSVLKETRDSRAATRAYCEGNKWLEENARAVGNLD